MTPNPIQNRYDFVMLFEAIDSNVNGDPDADNEPRFDPEDNRGLVTDVCLKRKIRNYVELTHGNQQGYDIFVGEGAVLNHKQKAAREQVRSKNNNIKNEELVKEAQQLMCATYFDVRAFGGVLSTGKTEKDDADCGQVKGPVQLTFSRSIDPITTQHHAITRMAVTNEKDKAKERTIGQKYTVSYGLYRGHGYISAGYAEKTGFSEADLKVLLEAIEKMFWHDQSAARTQVNLRGFYAFKHSCKWGDAAPYVLFELIKVEKRAEVDIPRSFADYTVTVDEAGLPAGVELIKIVANS